TSQIAPGGKHGPRSPHRALHASEHLRKHRAHDRLHSREPQERGGHSRGIFGVLELSTGGSRGPENVGKNLTDVRSNLDGIAQAELVKSGAVTALELVDAAIARIEAIEPEVHALAGVNFEAARKRGRECPQGPLGGVPFLVKDLIAYPGLRHSMGSRLFAG